MGSLPFNPRPITRLPATGFGSLTQFFKIQALPRQPNEPPPQIGPFFGAAPVPGKGLVNGLNDLLFPKPRPNEPVLPPRINPEATASALTALRLALGPAKFYRLLKVGFSVAIGGSIPEALVGLGVTETVQPVKEFADEIKSLFLPHRPVELKTTLFTSEASKAVANGVRAIDEELRLYLEGGNSEGSARTVGERRGREVTAGLLDLLLGEDAPISKTGLAGSFFDAAASAAAGQHEQWAELQAAAGVGTGRANLNPLPPEQGDP